MYMRLLTEPQGLGSEIYKHLAPLERSRSWLLDEGIRLQRLPTRNSY
jgi:hypothetical protein